jgi:hypothetical protein
MNDEFFIFFVEKKEYKKIIKIKIDKYIENDNSKNVFKIKINNKEVKKKNKIIIIKNKNISLNKIEKAKNLFIRKNIIDINIDKAKLM